MADSGYGPKPSNKIIVAGEPLKQTLKVETATNVYPGRLVKKGTNDDDIVVAGAYSSGVGPVGWAGYENTTKKHRPATVDTVYLQNAQINVPHGGKFVIVGSLAETASVVKGQLLKAVANGELSGATEGTDHVVAIAEETVDASGGAEDIMVRSLI